MSSLVVNFFSLSISKFGLFNLFKLTSTSLEPPNENKLPDLYEFTCLSNLFLNQTSSQSKKHIKSPLHFSNAIFRAL